MLPKKIRCISLPNGNVMGIPTYRIIRIGLDPTGANDTHIPTPSLFIIVFVNCHSFLCFFFMETAIHITSNKTITVYEALHENYYGIFQCPECGEELTFRKGYTTSNGQKRRAAFIHSKMESEYCSLRTNENLSSNNTTNCLDIISQGQSFAKLEKLIYNFFVEWFLLKDYARIIKVNYRYDQILERYIDNFDLYVKPNLIPVFPNYTKYHFNKIVKYNKRQGRVNENPDLLLKCFQTIIRNKGNRDYVFFLMNQYQKNLEVSGKSKLTIYFSKKWEWAWERGSIAKDKTQCKHKLSKLNIPEELNSHFLTLKNLFIFLQTSASTPLMEQLLDSIFFGPTVLNEFEIYRSLDVCLIRLIQQQRKLYCKEVKKFDLKLLLSIKDNLNHFDFSTCFDPTCQENTLEHLLVKFCLTNFVLFISFCNWRLLDDFYGPKKTALLSGFK